MTMAANIAKHISHLDLPNVWQLTEELYMHIQDRYKMHHVCVAHASTPNQFCIVIISCHPKWLHASRALRLAVALKSSNLFFGNLPECLFFHFLFKRCISLWYAFEYNNLCSEDLRAFLAGFCWFLPVAPLSHLHPNPQCLNLVSWEPV